MKIISKREAMEIQQQHPGSRLFRYSSGKYQWHGSASHYTGQDVAEISGVLAVYAVRRSDNNGPYTCLMCITTN
ncbi:DUF987 domain-containing protein [Enterobacter sp. 638]|nr:DUF987 domain-containing protein [Enterobacter sp. 638]